MKPQFYSHLIEINLEPDLEKLELNRKEKQELVEVAHSNLHHSILDMVLSELSEKDKRIFLTNLQNNDSEQLWKHLNQNVEKVEEKIKQTAENLIKELKKDIQKAKNP